MPAKERVLLVLRRGGAQRYCELLEALAPLTTNQVRYQLNCLRKAGLVQIIGGQGQPASKYCLAVHRPVWSER